VKIKNMCKMSFRHTYCFLMSVPFSKETGTLNLKLAKIEWNTSVIVTIYKALSSNISLMLFAF
jgi:hypothetical protein